MMKQWHRKMCLFLNVGLMTLLLTGCPVPTSNKPSASASKNAVLPYAAKPDQALVYIVQPYSIVDWYLVGGAASDADRYRSDVYLKSAVSSDYAYIGKLDSKNNLCFYAKPGQYSIKFKNTGATPATMQQSLSLNANAIKILGLERSSYSGGANNELKFAELGLTQGKGYINSNNTSGCANAGDLPTSVAGKVTVLYSVQFKNETAALWGLYSEANSIHGKIAELLKPGSSYTYEKKLTLPNKDFMESGLSLNDKRLMLIKIESPDKFQDSEKTILYNQTNENAMVYINIELPQNKIFMDVESRPAFATIRGNATCQIVKPAADVKVNCVVEIRPR